MNESELKSQMINLQERMEGLQQTEALAALLEINNMPVLPDFETYYATTQH